MNFRAKIGRNIVLTVLNLKPETTIKLHDSSLFQNVGLKKESFARYDGSIF